MVKKFLAFLKSDARGATAIEYSIIASLVSIIAIGAIVLIGQELGGTYDETAERIEQARDEAGI